jgi:hypothetical protein
MIMEPITDRLIFHPKNLRPPRDEQWEMKQLVIKRDGLTDCFWCRKPFTNIEDATLEHIFPLADGGRHDLRNCTLSCESCNQRNVPRGLIDFGLAAQELKAKRAEANRAANGARPEEKTDADVFKRFDAIARERRSKPMKHPDASFFLKNIHKQLGRQPPSSHDKHVFKSHFNRWLTAKAAQREGETK